jgi:hypothetical protein
MNDSMPHLATQTPPMVRTASLRAVLFLLSLALIQAMACAGQPTNWATGARVQQQLAAPLSVAWQGTPLGRALAALAESQQVAIVRDRRIDPDREITLAINAEPLGQAFERIAGHLKIGYCQLGPVAYLGPASVTSRLRTLAALRLEEARALPADARARMTLLKSWHWKMLAEPRALVADLAAEAKVEIVNADRIPHDLWPETDLPLLSWVDRLSLVAAQFGLTFRFSDEGRRVELVDIPDEVLLTRAYAGGKNPRGLARRWQRDLPAAKIEVEGPEVKVLASLEDHDQIQRRLSGTPTRKTTVKAGKELYQLAVENTALDQLVDELTQRLGLQFHWDRDATTAEGIAANQLVSVKIENADLDALLEAVFANTGLKFNRRGKTITERADK